MESLQNLRLPSFVALEGQRIKKARSRNCMRDIKLPAYNFFTTGLLPPRQ